MSDHDSYGNCTSPSVITAHRSSLILVAAICRRDDGLVSVGHLGWGGADLVVAVQGGDFVALGEGGVVEDCVDEVVQGAAEGQDGLAYVDEFCGLGADDVNAQQLPGVPVE